MLRCERVAVGKTKDPKNARCLGHMGAVNMKLKNVRVGMASLVSGGAAATLCIVIVS